jgi:hypothetical protein
LEDWFLPMDLESLSLFYQLMQLSKIFRSVVFKAAAYGYNTCRALNSAYATSDAPIWIDLRFIVNHFYGLHRADIGAGATADAFRQLGFTDEIDRH